MLVRKTYLLAFSNRLNKLVLSPFSLVHFDIWDPSHTITPWGSKYFDTFIDDYSRCSWILLPKKSIKQCFVFLKLFVTKSKHNVMQIEQDCLYLTLNHRVLYIEWRKCPSEKP